MKLKMILWLIIKRFADMIRINKEAVITSGGVAILSIVVFILNSIFPIVNQVLQLSTSTPWGAVTSIFAHGNLSHIEFNIIVLLVWAFYVLLQNDFMKDSFLSRQEISKRLRISMVLMFLSVIASNILWLRISVPGSTTLGSSGVVFAFAGVLLAFSLMNFLYISKKFRDKGVRMRMKLWNIIWNVFVCASLSILVIFQSSTFFGVGDPKINALIHLLSFLIAFLSVSIYEYYPLFLLPSMIKIASYLKSRK